MANGKVNVKKTDETAANDENVKNTKKTRKESSRAHAAAVLHELAEKRHDPDAIRKTFETGEYPYKRLPVTPTESREQS